MTRVLLACFPHPEALMIAVRRVKEEGAVPVDAFTPHPVDGLAEALGAARTPVRKWMLAGGLLGGFGAYFTEWFSAVIDLPINAGGRPLHSWEVFYLFPFEFGVLMAGIVGAAALLATSGLPRLNHPLFDVQGFERSSQDGFILAVEQPERHPERLRDMLLASEALWVREGKT
ncbi:MAG: DUF3341 domain-containing protein [Alphaproteobacteria bacterium]|nr:DUF3341 domain-containing protein [Alphaproteobacteria bacterium]